MDQRCVLLNASLLNFKSLFLVFMNGLVLMRRKHLQGPVRRAIETTPSQKRPHGQVLCHTKISQLHRLLVPHHYNVSWLQITVQHRLALTKTDAQANLPEQLPPCCVIFLTKLRYQTREAKFPYNSKTRATVEPQAAKPYVAKMHGWRSFCNQSCSS